MMTAPAVQAPSAILVPVVISRGPLPWLRAYRRMCAWELADLRLYLPVLSCVLLLQGAGFVLGIGLLFRHIPAVAAAFVVTGVPVVNLVTAGLIFEPQVVAGQRQAGSYDFIQSMPVPRSAAAAAWYTIAVVTALPAVVLALVTGWLRYHITFAITPAVVPAMLLTCFTGVLMGYAIAHGVRIPTVAQLASVTMIFVIFGFSPVMFPAAQLPGWLAAVNNWLPFGSMATIMRAALISQADGLVRPYLVVSGWAILSVLVAARAVGHRR
jgi:ABC-2 type transport system permease protein